jgi:hypothetical protein
MICHPYVRRGDNTKIETGGHLVSKEFSLLVITFARDIIETGYCFFCLDYNEMA